MKNTTLCYLEKDGCYLMLYRNKKENDENRDKWIGIGGKLQEGESPYDCARREIKEESGLTANSLFYRGIVTFVSDIYGTEYMHLFTSLDFTGESNDACDEGELVWVEKKKIPTLNIWEGDKIFLDLLKTEKDFFSLKLVYQGDKLIKHSIETRKTTTT
jgi:8-oxo-dGTP diphosphatase